MDAREQVAERYGRFAREEAPGRSALYADWAEGVSTDAAAKSVLARIPADRRQPPLVFAVARMLGAPDAPYAALSSWFASHADLLVAEVSRRSLQTNEPQRCAVLLPALSLIPGPIALLEVGASAGLCLYPDRYSYRFARGGALDPADGVSAVILECAVLGDGLPPARMPEIVWRAGIDLHPLDAAAASDRAFLSALVWPGEEGRAERITAALDIAAADPPRLFVGDGSDPTVLLDAARQAPAGATLVVTTPGVLPHIPRAGRARLVEAISGMDARWVSLHPSAAVGEGFALTLDGSLLAAADPLGAWLEWRTADDALTALP